MTEYYEDHLEELSPGWCECGGPISDDGLCADVHCRYEVERQNIVSVERMLNDRRDE